MTRTNGPFATTLLDAISAADGAKALWLDDETAAGGDRTAPSYLAWLEACSTRDIAQAALIASDEEIEWDVAEEGNVYTTVWAASAEKALELAEDNFDRSCYPDADESFTITIAVHSDLINQDDSRTVTIDPEVPECVAGDHDWQSPYSVLGGCKANPGVWASGHGQVSCTSVCALCGSYRTVDHGATNRSNGAQMTETSYRPADDRSLAWALT